LLLRFELSDTRDAETLVCRSFAPDEFLDVRR
jgi:hypothetical protein